ncbi:MAG: helix-turn-helix transcriptional regulator [Ruminococcus sp.]|nr:helix-turn-helix transcriptional regulator [Ruminococcus sp.]
MHILCENIRTLRKERGMTQKELSEKLGISDKTVSRWESGVQLPEASLIPALAEVLNVSIDTLYGIGAPAADEAKAAGTDEKKNIISFKIWMVAGTLFSLLGSLLYRYFGSTVFLSPNIIDVDYYNTAKGATADIFAFVGIVAIFAGIFAVVITKVRFAMLYKPQMPDSVFAENVRYTGAAIVVYSIIFMKTAPEILSFGYVVPREVYGYILVAALSGVLLWYRYQLKKRGIPSTKPTTVTALAIGGVGVIAAIAALIWRDALTFAVAMGDEVSYYSWGSNTSVGVTIDAILLTVSDWLILAMPILLYIDLMIRLRKIR